MLMGREKIEQVLNTMESDQSWCRTSPIFDDEMLRAMVVRWGRCLGEIREALAEPKQNTINLAPHKCASCGREFGPAVFCVDCTKEQEKPYPRASGRA